MYRARRPGSTADRDAHPFTPTAEFNVHIGSRAHRHRRRRSTLGLTRLASWAGFGGISSRQSRTGVTRTQCRHLLSLVGSDTKTAVHPQILGRYAYCLTWLNEYFRCRPRPPLGVPPSSLDGGRTAGLPVALLLPPSPTASARREGPAPDLEGHVLLHQQPGIRPSDHDSPRLLAPRPIPCQSWWASRSIRLSRRRTFVGTSRSRIWLASRTAGAIGFGGMGPPRRLKVSGRHRPTLACWTCGARSRTGNRVQGHTVLYFGLDQTGPPP